MKAVRIVCKGRVQGVFFRASTQKKASALGVLGWVRNEPNGDVLIHAQGEELAIDDLIRWSQQGPELAHVASVEVKTAEEEDLSAFDVRYG